MEVKIMKIPVLVAIETNGNINDRDIYNDKII